MLLLHDVCILETTILIQLSVMFGVALDHIAVSNSILIGRRTTTSWTFEHFCTIFFLQFVYGAIYFEGDGILNGNFNAASRCAANSETDHNHWFLGGAENAGELGMRLHDAYQTNPSQLVGGRSASISKNPSQAWKTIQHPHSLLHFS